MNITRPQIAQARVLVVGDAMLDRYWYGDVERISPEAPVPVVLVKREEERMGGAANVALNVASLGAHVSFIGVVGADEQGRKLENLLKTSGIRSHLALDASLSTTVKLRVIGRAQQLIRLDFETPPKSDALAVQTAAFERLIPQNDCVIFSDYAKGGLKHVSNMIATARALGKIVLVDPKGLDFSPYENAHIITPNQAELAAVIGRWHSEDELHSKAQALRERLALQALVLTRSEAGMTVFDADGALSVAAQVREVFDVTGAGDAVIAVLAAAIAAGLSPRQALHFANRAGGVVVGKFGTASANFDEVFGI